MECAGNEELSRRRSEKIDRTQVERSRASYGRFHEQSTNACSTAFRSDDDGPQQSNVTMAFEARASDDPAVLLRNDESLDALGDSGLEKTGVPREVYNSS